MQAAAIVALYNELLNSHKRLPPDADARMARGETIIIYNGTEEAWTSKLELHRKEGELHAIMHISHNVPAGMKTKLEAKRDEFETRRSQLL